VMCTVEVRTDGQDVAARWARLAGTAAARDYNSAWAPGAVRSDIASPRATPTASHFAVLEARVHAIDWLELDPRGHRRARVEGGRAVWLEP
jgi:hypothetical protein